MAVGENAISRKIVGNFDKVSRRGRLFARARDAGLGVTNNACAAVNHSRRNQRSQRDDDRGGIAARVRDQRGAGDLVLWQFRQAIHGFAGNRFCRGGIGIVEAIDGAMRFLLQPPGSAQIDHPHASLESLWSPFPRGFVRGSEEEKLHATFAQLAPVKRMHAQLSVPEHVWVVVGQIGGGVGFTREEQWLGETRMSAEKTREFKAGVAGRANDRSLELRAH